MDNPIAISLIVAGIGMLVLFLALAFLYGLMVLMTALIKDRPEAGAEEQRSREAEVKRRAAAIGVALARAELELSSVGPSAAESESETGASPWQQYHRHRLLNLHL